MSATATKSAEDVALEQHRAEQYAANTRGLKPGWYVTTGFFWHDSCAWVEGPFTTQGDAMLCRSAIEKREGHHRYFVDEVEGG